MHLVFVHLGSAKAEHLQPNIARTKKLFPEIPITLIYSDVELIRGFESLGIQLFKYLEVSHKDHILNNLLHNSKFRSNFWRYSIERLYALEQFHSENPTEKVVHLESDILIMPNFPFSRFDAIDKLAWCRFNQTHDVASVMYSPNHLETKWMLQEIDKFLTSDPSLTDMTVLRRLKLAFPSNSIYLNSEAGEKILEGVIDAAPFGMWLCGRDPRNHSGITRRFMKMPESEIDPSEYNFKFNSKTYLTVRRKNYASQSLFNLHLHSKQKTLFGNRWKLVLNLHIFTSKLGFPSSWFSLRAFIQLVHDYVKRHGRKSLLNFMKRLLNYR